MKKLIVLLIFLSSGFFSLKSCVAQNHTYNDTLISYFLLEDIRAISSNNTIYTKTRGFAGDENPYFLPFKNIKELSSIKDLELLIYHPCPAVRCCALYGLLNKKSDSAFSAIEYLSIDTASFNNQFIGHNSTLKVVDYVYSITYIEKLEGNYGYKLSHTRKKQIRKVRRKMKKLLSKLS